MSDTRQETLIPPTDPVWAFPIPGLSGQYYRIQQSAIAEVLPDDDYGRCKLVLTRAEGPILVGVSVQTVVNHLPTVKISKSRY